MSVAVRRPSTDRVIIRNVSWKTYERLLKDLENSSSPRLAYDQGVLEIMSPHSEHEEVNRTLASIVEIILEELELDFRNAGSTTFKREALERGFGPDSCFYIQNVERIRNKRHIDMEADPPPDLVIEIDLTNDSLRKFPLYAALGVPEVWRFEETLEVWVLDQDRYVQRQSSVALPIVDNKLICGLLEASFIWQRPVWFRKTRQRIRDLISRPRSGPQGD
jgi:Uma2 family endonuclease